MFSFCQALKDKPEIPDHLLMVWDSFWRLSRRRIQGFDSVCAIGFEQIESFCRINQIDDVAWFTELIEAMDAEYVRLQNEKIEAARKK